MMFRRALEAALKEKFKDKDMTGSLYECIDKAADESGLTPALVEWAHQIRLDGNEAAHGEQPFSKEDAQRLHDFVDLVFRYLFTLPGMLAEARGEPTISGDETASDT